MNRRKQNHLCAIVVSLVVSMSLGLSTLKGASLPASGLMGTVKSAAGKAMEGVAVSARAQDKSFTVSVYTNRAGEYFFPDMAAGEYRIWAQAVGFQTARSEQNITRGKKSQQNFSLQPLREFQKQLSSVEWANSLPSDTAEDRRMNLALNYNCTTCHLTGYVLSKRFDKAGWAMMIDYMINTQSAPGSLVRASLQAYKDELADYLARIRGPQPYPWKFKPLVRPTGEADDVVVTEYDVPRGDKPDYALVHNGSDWTEGIASRYESMVLHDAVVGKDGNVYFTDNATPERSIGKLDPRTGRVTGYKLADKNGYAVMTHGDAVDQQGNIWFTNGTEGTILKFDPKAEHFERFPKPSALTPKIGGTIAVDSKGNVWATQPNGAFRLNPKTGEYTEFKSVTPEGEPYGITIDSEDNAWYAQLEADRVAYVDGKTGQVGEVAVSPTPGNEISAKDRQIAEKSEKVNDAPAIYQKGPRRLGADPKGDTVWVGEYYAGRLAKIDIHTKKITEYPVPNRYSHPYSAVVDRNHMVWVNLMNADRVLKFNPSTEQFTEYPLPSLGTDSRFVDVDNSTDPVTVWVPYYRINKIARIEFRGSTEESGRSIAYKPH